MHDLVLWKWPLSHGLAKPRGILLHPRTQHITDLTSAIHIDNGDSYDFLLLSSIVCGGVRAHVARSALVISPVWPLETLDELLHLLGALHLLLVILIACPQMLTLRIAGLLIFDRLYFFLFSVEYIGLLRLLID